MSAADDLADEYDDTPRLDRLIDGATFILDEPTDVPSVWGTDDRVLWVEGEGFLLVGGSGVGKTTVGQQFTLRRIGVDTGDLLGLPVAANRRPAPLRRRRPAPPNRPVVPAHGRPRRPGPPRGTTRRVEGPAAR